MGYNQMRKLLTDSGLQSTVKTKRNKFVRLIQVNGTTPFYQTNEFSKDKSVISGINGGDNNITEFMLKNQICISRPRNV